MLQVDHSLLQPLRHHVAGQNGIDAYVVGTVLRRHLPGQTDGGGLAGLVHQHPGRHQLAVDGRRVDDAAAAGDVDDRWRVQWNARDPGVVTSHVWVAATGEAPVPDAGPTTTTPDEGCGCRTGGDTGSGALPLLLVFALLRQRKRC